jgi:hypothetical protein
MFRVRMVRTRQVWKRRPVLAGGRRMKFALRAGLVGMMMHAGIERVAGGIVMFLALVVCQIVLRCFRD